MKPTYEEFRALVKDHFSKTMEQLSDDQVETFLDDEDSVDVIKQEYDLSSKQLDRGEITEEIFRTGSVSAASSTLYMLY